MREPKERFDIEPQEEPPLSKQRSGWITASIRNLSMDEICGTRSTNGWGCCREKNHEGPHIATGTIDVYAIWD